MNGEAWNYQPETLYSCTWSSVDHSSERLEDQDVHNNNSNSDRDCANKDSKGVKRTQQGSERGHLCYVLANKQTYTHRAASYPHPGNLNEAEFKSNGLIGKRFLRALGCGTVTAPCSHPDSQQELQAEQESVDKTVGEGSANKAAALTTEASAIKESPSTLHRDSGLCQQAPSHQSPICKYANLFGRKKTELQLPI